MKLVKKVKILNTNRSEDLMYYPFNDKNLEQKYLCPKTIQVKEIKMIKSLTQSDDIVGKEKISKESITLPDYT
jgi:hypothetical protein